MMVGSVEHVQWRWARNDRLAPGYVQAGYGALLGLGARFDCPLRVFGLPLATELLTVLLGLDEGLLSLCHAYSGLYGESL
jgi:hypothetical protein